MTDRRKAGTLMRVAVAVLLLPVALSAGLVVAVYLHIESILSFILLLAAASMVLAAFGAGLVACALRLLGHGEEHPASTADKGD